MIRFLWIPVSGTVAALIAILLAHPAREEEALDPLSDPRDTAIERTVDEEPEEIDPREFEPPREEPAETIYNIAVNEDGTLLDTASDKSYADAAKLIEAVAPEGTRPTVLLFNATGAVTQETLEAVAAALREKCKVRTSFRAPDK